MILNKLLIKNSSLSFLRMPFNSSPSLSSPYNNQKKNTFLLLIEFIKHSNKKSYNLLSSTEEFIIEQKYQHQQIQKQNNNNLVIIGSVGSDSGRLTTEVKKYGDGIRQKTSPINYYSNLISSPLLPFLKYKRYYSINMNNNNNQMKLKMPQIYLTRPDVAPIGIELLKKECDVSSWSHSIPVPRDEFLRNVCGKDGIFCTLNDKIDAELLDCAGTNLKVIGTMSVGFDHIDVDECKARGIRIGYTPDILTDATAELTIGLLLATSRRLIESHKEVYNGGWSSWSPGWMCGPGLKNSCVGIIGFGRIGQEVAKRIKPFKPSQMVYSNRTERPMEANSIGIDFLSFDELLKISDFIIITTALTADTTHLINSKTIGKMKENVILINTARGGIVEQNDLYAALKEKRIRAAGLDVTSPEPLPLDSPLLTLPNCIVLPHIGSADINTRIEMSRITANNILNGLKGMKMLAEL